MAEVRREKETAVALQRAKQLLEEEVRVKADEIEGLARELQLTRQEVGFKEQELVTKEGLVNNLKKKVAELEKEANSVR
jgi:hypothetical protein